MLWLISAAGGAIYSPAPPKRNADVLDTWVSSTLTVKGVEDFSPKAAGEAHGQAVHLYGTWSDPQEIPSAYILLGTGDASDVKAITLYVKGEGKYRVQVFLQKGDRLHMTQAVVEADASWKPVRISTEHTVEVIGGLMDRPGVKFPFKVVLLPYMSKDEGESSRVFNVSVSPVFVIR